MSLVRVTGGDTGTRMLHCQEPLVRRNTVVRSHQLPLAVRLHPQVGHAIAVIVWLSRRLALLVVASVNYRRISVHSYSEIAEFHEVHLFGRLVVVHGKSALAVEAAILHRDHIVIGQRWP